MGFDNSFLERFSPITSCDFDNDDIGNENRNGNEDKNSLNKKFNPNDKINNYKKDQNNKMVNTCNKYYCNNNIDNNNNILTKNNGQDENDDDNYDNDEIFETKSVDFFIEFHPYTNISDGEEDFISPSNWNNNNNNNNNIKIFENSNNNQIIQQWNNNHNSYYCNNVENYSYFMDSDRNDNFLGYINSINNINNDDNDNNFEENGKREKKMKTSKFNLNNSMEGHCAPASIKDDVGYIQHDYERYKEVKAAYVRDNNNNNNGGDDDDDDMESCPPNLIEENHKVSKNIENVEINNEIDKCFKNHAYIDDRNGNKENFNLDWNFLAFYKLDSKDAEINKNFDERLYEFSNVLRKVKDNQDLNIDNDDDHDHDHDNHDEIDDKEIDKIENNHESSDGILIYEKVKRKPIKFSKSMITRINNYIRLFSNVLNLKTTSRSSNNNNNQKILINNQNYNIISQEIWKPFFLMYQIPNNCNNIKTLIIKFNVNQCNGNWIYHENYNGQPMLKLSYKRLPLRHCGQIANYYEPFIIRERRKDGRLMKMIELKRRIYLYSNNKNKENTEYLIEAMCPYCPINENFKNDINNYFFGRTDSEYLHHVTKHHGVYSDGTEHDLPEFVCINSKRKYFAYCLLCEELIKIKPFPISELDENNLNLGNRFLNYLRHCIKHKKNNKNGSGISRNDRGTKIIVSSVQQSLVYEKI